MTHSGSYGDEAEYVRNSSPRRTIVGAVAVLAATGGIGYWGYSALLADEPEDPQVTAATEQLTKFLGAWEKGDAARAGGLTDTPDRKSVV